MQQGYGSLKLIPDGFSKSQSHGPQTAADDHHTVPGKAHRLSLRKGRGDFPAKTITLPVQHNRLGRSRSQREQFFRQGCHRDIPVQFNIMSGQ